MAPTTKQEQNLRLLLLFLTVTTSSLAAVVSHEEESTQLPPPPPPPVVHYLPDVAQFEDITTFGRYWDEEEPSSAYELYLSGKGERFLKVSHNNLSFEDFVLKSRPIELPPIDAQVPFHYVADGADWVQQTRLDFEFYSQNSTIKFNTAVIMCADEIRNNKIDIMHNVNVHKDWQANTVVIRASHRVKSTTREQRNLNITKLAFGDACASESRCASGGRCQAIGLMESRCNCSLGYYGDKCENWSDSCGSSKQNNESGFEICKKLDATCVLDSIELQCKREDGSLFTPQTSQYYDTTTTTTPMPEMRRDPVVDRYDVSYKQEEEPERGNKFLPFASLGILILIILKLIKRCTIDRYQEVGQSSRNLLA